MTSGTETHERTKIQKPTQYPEKISILSLNCWGLKYISRYRHERLKEIGAQIARASPTPDIVGLQECWTQQDYNSIREQTEHILPYAKFYYSGIFGGGLAILSRWPIEGSTMFRYPLNGRPTAFWRGDWYVGKGVACARIRIGPARSDIIQVFNTHLHAPYAAPNTSGAYKEHRTAQAWEIAKLLRHAHEAGHLVLAMGDFNLVPSSLAYKIIATHGNVVDIWRELHPNSTIAALNNRKEQRRQALNHTPQQTNANGSQPPKDIPTATWNITENGTTCDSALNTWRWDKTLRKQLHAGRHIDEDAHLRASPDVRAKRLDYIFLGTGGTVAHAGRVWEVEDAKVGMTGRHPTLRCSLSDHFSVEATIVLRGGRMAGDAERNEYLAPRMYDKILSFVHGNMVRARKQRRLRLGHFVASVCVEVVCLVGVWWSPHHYVAFILLLVGSLGLAAGVVDGLIGGLFFGQELRALKEWEWEVLNAREAAVLESGEQEVVDGDALESDDGV